MEGIEAPLIVRPAFHRTGKVAGKLRLADEIEESGMRVEAGDDDIGVQRAALPELDTGGGTLAHDDLVHLGTVENGSAGADELAGEGGSQLVRTALAIALVHAAIDEQ